MNSNAVTTPKLPPPPRSAQNKSVCSDGVARVTSPSAVTTSIAVTWFAARPCWRANQLRPPPSVYATTPMSGEEPESGYSPNGDVASVTSSQIVPAWTRAIRFVASISTPRMCRVDSRIVSASEPSAPALWPVPCGAIRNRWWRAYRTMARTSSRSRGIATSAGRRSTARFHACRAASHPGSPGATIRPRIEATRSARESGTVSQSCWELVTRTLSMMRRLGVGLDSVTSLRGDSTARIPENG